MIKIDMNCKFHKTPLRKSTENKETYVCDKCKSTKEFGHDGLYHLSEVSNLNLNYKNNLKEVLHSFDFNKVYHFMLVTDWKYRDKHMNLYTPLTDELVEKAVENLNKVAQGVISGCEDYEICTGGFHYRAYKSNNEILFSMKFVLTESYNE